MTVLFRDPSFHTEGNLATQTPLLKKVEAFTDAQEGKTIILFRIYLRIYFVKIINILHILRGACTFMSTNVYTIYIYIYIYIYLYLQESAKTTSLQTLFIQFSHALQDGEPF